MIIRTRMAPSPTGKLHLGTAYATLWPYLFARSKKGVFVLRLEDTDESRSTKEYAEDIIDGLRWLGFEWDEGPFYQMERLELYKSRLDELLGSGRAYGCFCTVEELEDERRQQAKEKRPQIYSGKCRDLSKDEVERKKSVGLTYTIRFRMPSDRGIIKFDDMIHGNIRFESSLVGDFVISRSSGVPLYNFVVVVDDIDMEITHVLRGDDHISNTPKQIVLFEAFGAKPPEYGHYPMILNEDRVGKLSKRTGSTPVEYYRQEGYLPEAFLNYLLLLGWSAGEKEIWSMDEVSKVFKVSDMNKAAAAWSQQKLDWINGEYIRSLSNEELTKKLEDYLVDYPGRREIAKLVALVKERMKKLSDYVGLTQFLYKDVEYSSQSFETLKVKDLPLVGQRVVEELEKLPSPWQKLEFEEKFQSLAKELNLSNTQVFQFLRLCVSGQLVTPPLFEIMEIFGEQESVTRVKKAVTFIE